MYLDNNSCTERFIRDNTKIIIEKVVNLDAEFDDESPADGHSDAYIVEELPVYVSLAKVQSYLRCDRISATIITIGCSFATYYLSIINLWGLICGLLVICLGIMIDYSFVERGIRKIEKEKKKVRIVPGSKGSSQH